MRRMQQKGFTLIELLVVIAIIAILASILLPVFAQARAKARQAACTSNLKQLTLGFMMYNQDYDGAFPQWAWGVGSTQGGGQDEYYTFWMDAIYPYVKSAGVYTCPNDLAPVTPAQTQLWWWSAATTAQGLEAVGIQPALVNQVISYGMSEPIENGSTTFMGTGSWNVPIPPVTEALMKKPAETLLVADCAVGLTAWPSGVNYHGTWPVYPDPNDPTDVNHQCIIHRVAYPNPQNPNDNDDTWGGDCITPTGADGTTSLGAHPSWVNDARHSGGGVIGFADGHVKYLKQAQITDDLWRGDSSS